MTFIFSFQNLFSFKPFKVIAADLLWFWLGLLRWLCQGIRAQYDKIGEGDERESLELTEKKKRVLLVFYEVKLTCNFK
jgi:hypothetical protein